MWTYFNTPFLFALPGVHTEEIEPWQENGETWRRLKVTFPRDIATHSTEQTFYFDQKGLLKRHDYDVEISGASPGAHYVSASESGRKFRTSIFVIGSVGVIKRNGRTSASNPS